MLELDPRVRGYDQAVVQKVFLEDQPELERHLAGPDLGLDVEGQTDRVLVGAQEAIDALERDAVEAHRAVLLRRVVIEGDVEAFGEMRNAVVLGVEVAVVDVARDLEVVGQAVFHLGAKLEVVIVTEGLPLAVGEQPQNVIAVQPLGGRKWCHAPIGRYAVQAAVSPHP